MLLPLGTYTLQLAKELTSRLDKLQTTQSDNPIAPGCPNDWLGWLNGY